MATATTAVRETEQQLRQRIDALAAQRQKIESELTTGSQLVEQAKAKRAEAVATLLASSPGSERSKIHSTVPSLMEAFFRGSHTSKFVTCGFSNSYNQAAEVPSSNVTCKSPRSPSINCRIMTVVRLQSAQSPPKEKTL